MLILFHRSCPSFFLRYIIIFARAKRLRAFSMSNNRLLKLDQYAKSNRTYWIVAAVAFLVFANSLSNFFLMDDFWHLNKIAQLNWTNWWVPWSYSAKDNNSYWMAMHQIRGLENAKYFFRPLVTLVFFLNDQWGGGVAWPFHLSNILLHLLTSLTVFGIARIFFKKGIASLGAALLFAIHPSHCESVQWIAANGDLLAGLFFALAFYAHLRIQNSENNISWGWGFLSIFSFLLALGSKEMAIMFPAVTLLYDLLLSRSKKTKFSKSFYILNTVYALIALFYLYSHFQVIQSVSELNSGGKYIAHWTQDSFVSVLLINLAAYLLHFWTLFPLMPVDLNFSWKEALPFILGGWGLLLAFYLWLRSKIENRKQFYFFISWMILTLLPSLSILMSGRVLYISSIGFALLVGLILKEHVENSLEKKKKRLMIFSLVLFLCFTVTFLMNKMWSLPSEIIRDHIAQISSEIPSIESDSRIYLIDLWPPSYGIEEGLKRFYHDRNLDVQVLTFNPKILDSSQSYSKNIFAKLFGFYFPKESGTLLTNHFIEKKLDETIHLHLELLKDVYFQELVESLLPVESRLGNELKEIQTERFKAVLGTTENHSVNKIDFYFPRQNKNSYFLIYENGKYRRMVI